jgi:hypothetical protein
LDFPPQYRNTSSTGPPPLTASGQTTALLCLTRDQSLVRVPRPVETPPTPAELLADLTVPATEAESQQGLTSALAGIRGLSVSKIEDGVAEVSVGDSLEGITGSTLLLIYGQIVCTLDEHPAISGIWFSQDGQRLQVPQGNTAVTDEVLTADDYVELLEASATPTQ